MIGGKSLVRSLGWNVACSSSEHFSRYQSPRVVRRKGGERQSLDGGERCGQLEPLGSVLCSTTEWQFQRYATSHRRVATLELSLDDKFRFLRMGRCRQQNVEQTKDRAGGQGQRLRWYKPEGGRYDSVKKMEMDEWKDGRRAKQKG